MITGKKNNFRTYGGAPFDLAVIHGGPGVAGEMAPVARKLASFSSVLEPFQTTTTLKGQVEELRTVLDNQGAPPNTLIGFSWGAWLSVILAAHYPSLVRKLILVSSGPFEDKYVSSMQECRFSRLTVEDKIEFEATLASLSQGNNTTNSSLLKRLGELASKTDTYDAISPCENPSDILEPSSNIFQAVMQDALKMRSSGELLKLVGDIVCPVVAIHGTYDPHPADGVEEPLSATLRDFRFIRLNNCGHKPWIERQARDNFFEVLQQEIRC